MEWLTRNERGVRNQGWVVAEVKMWERRVGQCARAQAAKSNTQPLSAGQSQSPAGARAVARHRHAGTQPNKIKRQMCVYLTFSGTVLGSSEFYSLMWFGQTSAPSGSHTFERARLSNLRNWHNTNTSAARSGMDVQ